MTDVFEDYPKAVAHLRYQFENKRLGLVLGAGISKGLGYPDWLSLVKGIAKHPEVDGYDLYEETVTTSSSIDLTQLLFQYFKSKHSSIKKHSDFTTLDVKLLILADWRKVIYDVLYKDALHDRELKFNDHPYLKYLIKIVEQLDLTINYNFDDTLEQMLSTPETGHKKKYQAVWGTSMQHQAGVPVIYHPNGYLPGNKITRKSEELVLSDEGFSDQLIDSMSGAQTTLLHQFTKKTCLFIGVSLEDKTLKHLLRQSASLSPGNYHYAIRYTPSNSPINQIKKDAIFNANFEVYNLITLFLDNAGISQLLPLISSCPEKFSEMVGSDSPLLKYVYYLTGSVGAGKSTILNHFGSLNVHEEWLNSQPEELAKPFKLLTPAERVDLDSWIDTQFYLKNELLRNENFGIHFIDRTPLDPITFSESDKAMTERARKMLIAIRGNEQNTVENGQMIFLDSHTSDIQNRLLVDRKTSWDDDHIDTLKKRAHTVYGSHITKIDTSGRHITDVVREIARVIFVDEYKPEDLQTKLENLSKEIER